MNYQNLTTGELRAIMDVLEELEGTVPIGSSGAKRSVSARLKSARKEYVNRTIKSFSNIPTASIYLSEEGPTVDFIANKGGLYQIQKVVEQARISFGCQKTCFSHTNEGYYLRATLMEDIDLLDVKLNFEHKLEADELKKLKQQVQQIHTKNQKNTP